MLNCSTKTRKGWGLVDEMVKRWIQQRIELTQSYESIIAPPAQEGLGERIAERTSFFCQSLVDYVSAGHFEIYNELLHEAKEFGEDSVSQHSEIFSAIAHSTDLALDFNDKYESRLKRVPVNRSASIEFIRELPDDLTTLGKLLNHRFELEDKLIAKAHNRHRSLIG